jgi:hypothetical protein
MSDPPADRWPIGMAEAAKRLGKSKRWLQMYLRNNPAGRMAGRSRLFMEEDFEALVRSLPRDRGVPPLNLKPVVRGRRRSVSFDQPVTVETWTERQRQRIKEKREQKLKDSQSRS